MWKAIISMGLHMGSAFLYIVCMPYSAASDAPPLPLSHPCVVNPCFFLVESAHGLRSRYSHAVKEGMRWAGR